MARNKSQELADLDKACSWLYLLLSIDGTSSANDLGNLKGKEEDFKGRLDYLLSSFASMPTGLIPGWNNVQDLLYWVQELPDESKARKSKKLIQRKNDSILYLAFRAINERLKRKVPRNKKKELEHRSIAILRGLFYRPAQMLTTLAYVARGLQTSRQLHPFLSL